MAIAHVIYSFEDRGFVEGTLLRSLPSNGFDGYSSLEPELGAGAIYERDVILIVLSRAAIESGSVLYEIDHALRSRRPVIVVPVEPIADEDRARLPEELWSRPLIDATSSAEEELADLLPPVESGTEEAERSDSYPARPIRWDEEILSTSLARVLKQHDHDRARVLIEALARYLDRHPFTYPPGPANADLDTLRKDRQFKLMQLYAEAVLASGTADARVRRQYAQALIEQKEFKQALQVLESILQDRTAPRREITEAYGLRGRTYKQQYVDDPEASGSHTLLHRAIEAYESVYDKDPSQLWHGINAASCRLRAHRDGVEGADPDRARWIAGRVLEEIDRLDKEAQLGVWDYATKVEALLALDRYDEALPAADAYIHHPDMHAFEVSSTYRQFDQLLQLDQNEPGRPILESLRQAVERYRAGGLSEPVAASGTPRPLILRVTDPDWQPANVADLVLEARMGTIVSARGTDASVASLLKDAHVISIDQSRPGGTADCDRSIPFIRVAADYPCPQGTYQENGDGTLIAVIDYGIDVLHEAFLDEQGQSRIVGIWDQAHNGTPPKGFTFGTWHSAADIAGYIKNKTVPPGLGRNPGGHGTHVASIAGGRPAGLFAGGVAPGARLLIVISASQGPTGYSKSHLDALTFVDSVAAELGLPVVVNLSQGMNAGAHDGTSALEIMFEAFSEGGRKPGRVIVKSAGNERSKNGHAKVTVKPDGKETLPWKREPGALGGERLELWWSSGDELSFRLQGPANDWTPKVNVSAPKQTGTLSGVPFVLQLTRRHIDNGDSQLIVEIGDNVSKAPPGLWQIEIVGEQVPEGGEVHAWIERGLGTASSFTKHMDEEMTLSIPGTARTVITVGAVDAAVPIETGDFSSYGPTRDGRNKPDVAAPGVKVKAAQGGTSTGAVSMDGTSMAAPHATGAIALLLSRMVKTQQPIPTATQIVSALRQKTRNYNSRWDPGQGYGVLDVAALLAAF